MYRSQEEGASSVLSTYQRENLYIMSDYLSVSDRNYVYVAWVVFTRHVIHTEMKEFDLSHLYINVRMLSKLVWAGMFHRSLIANLWSLYIMSNSLFHNRQQQLKLLVNRIRSVCFPSRPTGVVHYLVNRRRDLCKGEQVV